MASLLNIMGLRIKKLQMSLFITLKLAPLKVVPHHQMDQMVNHHLLKNSNLKLHQTAHQALKIKLDNLALIVWNSIHLVLSFQLKVKSLVILTL
jgi:hypothetical protein